MSDFALACAAGADAAELTATCANQLGDVADHSIGFVYATAALAGAFPAMVEALRRRTGIASWVGTVGHGVCATGAEHFDEPAVVALTCRLEPGSFRLVPSVTDAGAGLPAASGGLGQAIGIVHGDPRNPAVTDIVAGLARRTGTYLVGGLTSAENAFPQAAGDRIGDGGVSGVLLGGRRLRVAAGLTQGCSPIGRAHVITKGEGQVVATLDGRPAFEVLREDAGAADGDDPRQWLARLHAALPVAGSDRADYVVRNLTGIDPGRGLIAIADSVAAGDRLLFVRRDRESAGRDLERMLADVKARATAAPRAGLYFSCLARGPNLFADGAHEMRAIERALGPIPVAGFFGNGEIAHDRVYGYTGVLTVLY